MPSFLAAEWALPVADERAAVQFYVETLGFTELLSPDAIALAILVRDKVEVPLWVSDGSVLGAERHLAGSASRTDKPAAVRARLTASLGPATTCPHLVP